MLCTSGFVDDVMFSYNEPLDAITADLLQCCIWHRLTPLLLGIGCVLF